MSDSAADSKQTPTVIVRAGSPTLTLLIALVIGLGAFFGGMYFERAKRADYTVRVVGVPDQITVVGAPDNITVRGIPERIQVAGGVQGIPDTITFRGTSLEGILPKGIEVRTAATGQIDNRHMIAVTPQGSVYMIYFDVTRPGLSLGGASTPDYGQWKVSKLAGP